MEKVIRVGIAGFGLSGQVFHAPFLKIDPRYSLRKVYERTTNRAKEEYPEVEIVRSFEELLTEDIDLVVISTPNQQHVPMATAAIMAGKDVVVEKPVAATAEEAEALCALAEKQGVLLTVYQNRRLDGDFLTLKKLMEEGRLGEVVDYKAQFDRFVRGVSYKPWKLFGDHGVDILYDLGVHLIDQAYDLFGMPKEVYCDMRTQRPESGGVDNFEAILYYDNCKAILTAGELVAHPGPHYAVYGRRGGFIKYGMDHQEDDMLAGKRPDAPDWNADPEACWGTLYYDTGDTIAEEIIPTVVSSYSQYYDNLYHAITEGAPLLVPPRQSVDVLKIIEAAQRSNQEKRRISL